MPNYYRVAWFSNLKTVGFTLHSDYEMLCEYMQQKLGAGEDPWSTPNRHQSNTTYPHYGSGNKIIAHEVKLPPDGALAQLCEKAEDETIRVDILSGAPSKLWREVCDLPIIKREPIDSPPWEPGRPAIIGLVAQNSAPFRRARRSNHPR